MGETRWQHIQKHGVNNTNKPLHGVFDNDPVLTTQEAWYRTQLDGVKPILDNGVDVYIVPMGRRIGWQGGANGTGAPLTSVKIVTQPGTTRIITAHPQ